MRIHPQKDIRDVSICFRKYTFEIPGIKPMILCRCSDL